MLVTSIYLLFGVTDEASPDEWHTLKNDNKHFRLLCNCPTYWMQHGNTLLVLLDEHHYPPDDGQIILALQETVAPEFDLYAFKQHYDFSSTYADVTVIEPGQLERQDGKGAKLFLTVVAFAENRVSSEELVHLLTQERGEGKHYGPS